MGISHTMLKWEHSKDISSASTYFTAKFIWFLTINLKQLKVASLYEKAREIEVEIQKCQSDIESRVSTRKTQ